MMCSAAFKRIPGRRYIAAQRAGQSSGNEREREFVRCWQSVSQSPRTAAAEEFSVILLNKDTSYVGDSMLDVIRKWE